MGKTLVLILIEDFLKQEIRMEQKYLYPGIMTIHGTGF